MTYRQYGARCLDCGDEIYSNQPDDFEDCRCGALSIEGGLSGRVYYDADSHRGYERIERSVGKDRPRFYRDERRVVSSPA